MYDVTLDMLYQRQSGLIAISAIVLFLIGVIYFFVFFLLAKSRNENDDLKKENDNFKKENIALIAKCNNLMKINNDLLASKIFDSIINFDKGGRKK